MIFCSLLLCVLSSFSELFFSSSVKGVLCLCYLFPIPKIQCGLVFCSPNLFFVVVLIPLYAFNLFLVPSIPSSVNPFHFTEKTKHTEVFL